jgi:hypothetical protein
MLSKPRDRAISQRRAASAADSALTRTAHFSGEYTDPSVKWPHHTIFYKDGMLAFLVDSIYHTIFFYGRVIYKDDLDVSREMAFYRKLEPGSHRFIPWGDPQLEYSDANP